MGRVQESDTKLFEADEQVQVSSDERRRCKAEQRLWVMTLELGGVVHSSTSGNKLPVNAASAFRDESSCVSISISV